MKKVFSSKTFSPYQVFIITVLTFLQFTIVLDFMVLSPLGAMLMDQLSIPPSKFGMVVSAYAFSAGASGLMAAGFADKYDRKRLLMFFYTGFMLGTLFCALAPNYEMLLAARVVTGIFGGVVGSISFAIITDLFKLEVRGRVMGFVQMAFAGAQVLGLPIGLILANNFGWHAPFWMIAIVGTLAGILISIYMKPVTDHLKIKNDRNPFQHFIRTASVPRYLKAFLATTLLATGGYMLMPFGSAFSIHNLGLTLEQLPILYGITGVTSIAFGPLIGRWSDKIGKYKIFVGGTLLSMTVVAIYTHFGITPLWIVVGMSMIMFVGISSRMISASALMTGIPEPQDRGAFMSISSSIQQISGGVAAAVAGMIVVQVDNGPLQRYDLLGFVVIVTMLISILLMYFINKEVEKPKSNTATLAPENNQPVAEAI
ncbi:MAG TPA: MFS transporter [Cyclobacteriaceae bacterium]|nr:MFS transporter [Cyclobacteriaceae bacterium]